MNGLIDLDKLANILDIIYVRQFCMYPDSPREAIMIAVLKPVEQVWYGSDGQLYKAGLRLTTSPRRESLRPGIVYPNGRKEYK